LLFLFSWQFRNRASSQIADWQTGSEKSSGMPKKLKEKGVGAVDSFVMLLWQFECSLPLFGFFPVVCFECLMVHRCVGGMGTWSWNGDDEWS
jgi:hypothetical protein